MIWDRVRGHQTQVEMFRQSIRAGRFSQAYLLLGLEGIGKRLFVKTLAQCLFCQKFPDEALDACGTCSACRQMEAGSHPDLIEVGCPEGKSIFPIEVIAGSKERRGREGLCYDITLRPMAAARRIALIDDAHRMNAESANALLKTLEEPPSYATLFLLAPQAESLLPTIQSRCQAVRFSPLSDSNLADLLLEQNCLADRTEAESVAALSEGSLTVAKQLLNPEVRRLREALFNGLANPKFHPLELSKTLLEGIDEIGGDTHEKRQTAGWLVRFAIEFFRRAMLSLAGPVGAAVSQVSRFAERLDPNLCDDIEKVTACLDRCVLAERQIQRNAPAQMVFECLFADLARAIEPAVPAGR
jgi:DNA polymerase III subunit delta'